MGEKLNPENCPDAGWKYLTEQYQHHNHGTYNVTTEALNSLLVSEKILWALMQCGVHNFERFDEAMILAKAEETE